MNELTLAQINEKVEQLTREYAGIKNEIRTIKETGNKTARTVKDMEEEYPLLPPEADDLSRAVKHKGVSLMGGKSSAAYKNADLRKQVYRDIYGEIKRQYGLFNERGGQLSYKKLKRKHLSGAFMVVDQYVLPTVLEESVQAENDLQDME